MGQPNEIGKNAECGSASYRPVPAAGVEGELGLRDAPAKIPAAPPRHSLVWKSVSILLGDCRGVEMLEFALVLPLVLVMVTGLLDFASAFNINQKLSNAAREGARLGASQVKADLQNSPSASIQSIRDDVVNYLNNASVNTAFIGSSPTSWTPCTLGGGGNCGTATYCSQTVNGTCIGLTIEANVHALAADGSTFSATRVTLTYPYDWTYGFNKVVKLLQPSSAYPGQIPIGVDATMENLANGG
jgi:Flp pilus assembly protein TadG